MSDNVISGADGGPSSERSVPGSTVDALFVRALRGRMTATLRQRLREVGVDVDRPMQLTYPASIFSRAIEIAAEELYPDKSSADGIRALGESEVYGLEKSRLGRAKIAVARWAGPMQTLKHLPEELRAGGSPADTRVTPTGPHGARLDVVEYWLPVPDFMRGTLEASLAITHTREPRVQVAAFDPSRHTVSYQVDWT